MPEPAAAPQPTHQPMRAEVVDTVATTVNRRYWDDWAPGYQAEHGRFLAGVPGARQPGGATSGARPTELSAAFIWGPEGLDEAEAGLLGDVAGRDVLEVGAGAAQCSRWLAEQGARVVALDLSAAMLGFAPASLPRVQADAARLPFASRSFDMACSAYGALPFTPHADYVLADVARVLRPDGRYVFSVSHPIRWAMPDDPGPDGLRITMPYFDRLPYVERDAAGAVRYAEFHRTLGDWVRLIRSAGLTLDDVVEPEWPDDLEAEWGGWSPLRGALIPGTAIFSCRLP